MTNKMKSQLYQNYIKNSVAGFNTKHQQCTHNTTFQFVIFGYFKAKKYTAWQH